MSDPTLPAVFLGRSSRVVGTASPIEVRRLRDSKTPLGLALCLLLLTIPFGIFFLPLFVIFPLASLYFFNKWMGILAEARSGTVKKASCPSCERAVLFWVTTAFSCPYCKHMLMPYEGNLYDITK
jgi:hypothetical protein